MSSTVRDWNIHNPDIKNVGALDSFKHKLSKFLRVIPNITTLEQGNTKYGIQELKQAVAHLK